jgi:hypothetical protein
VGLVRLLVPALVAALLGCESQPRPVRLHPKERYFDDVTAAFFTASTKVEVFRVDETKAPLPGEGKVSGYPVIGRGSDQGAAFAVELARVLSDPATYSVYMALCFEPGVGFRVWKGKRCIDLILCFECNNCYLGAPKEDMVGATFSISDSARSRLVRLAKVAFPDDKAIQGPNE